MQISGDDPGRRLAGSAFLVEHLLQFAVEFLLRELRKLPEMEESLRLVNFTKIMVGKSAVVLECVLEPRV